ncbi:MAG TPA: hypothetical protein VM554_02475 [Acidisarcina sp.]|nr:hypothetical protein [Acidisarcina sp.]
MVSARELTDQGLLADARWQLVERIVATEPFRRSARYRDLLRYLVERAITNHPEDLSETHIGQAVFGKRPDYSPTEDSTVRVHVRQLRLKLHEYFDVAGREESILLEIPKGGFVPIFREGVRTVAPSLADAPPAESPATVAEVRPRSRFIIPSLLGTIALLLAVIAYLSFLLQTSAPPTHTPWPLSFFVSSDEPTAIVTADVNYGMMNLIQQKHRTLQEYLTKEAGTATSSGPDQSLLGYIGLSSLTSSADAVIAAGLSSLMAGSHRQVSVRSARDLRPRDLDFGNFIFLGSPTSNPWVSEYLDRTNFEEEEDTSGGYIWKNKSPRPGEQSSFKCLKQTGTSGDDYADIAFLPGRTGKGYVLILQGCQQEGTESTLLYLGAENRRRDLLKALGFSRPPDKPVFFEALIRTQVIAGAPSSTTVVAARVVNAP